MPEKYVRKPNCICKICGENIYRRPGVLEQNQGSVYCSQECYGKACRKENPCLVCGASILARENKKTCSRACANAYRKGIQYKIGRPKKDKVSSLKALRMRLSKERGRQCERCGYDTFQVLQIHHIDRNPKNNSLENLALICPNCHYEEHYLDKR